MKKLIFLAFALWSATTCFSQVAILPDRVGIGIASPDPSFGLEVGDNVLIRTNLGGLHLGFPNNGNLWRLSTTNSGSELLFGSKPSAVSSFNTRFIFFQEGDICIGGASNASKARLEVVENSTIDDPQILLTESQNDYSRLSFENSTYSNARWTVAGLPTSNASSSRLNFWFQNPNGGGDMMTVLGNGRVGIFTNTPTARLEINQAGQTVGNGLRFDDGTANEVWDITHGYGLRFHYGGTLKAAISATNGAYIQSSDRKLKKDLKGMDKTLAKIKNLNPMFYRYSDDQTAKRSMGFVAQEVEKVYPELVYYSEPDKIYGIDYTGFGTIAIKGIQELAEELEQKEIKIETLEARIVRLEQLLEH